MTVAVSENVVSFTFAPVTTPPFILVTLVIGVDGKSDQAPFLFFHEPALIRLTFPVLRFPGRAVLHPRLHPILGFPAILCMCLPLPVQNGGSRYPLARIFCFPNSVRREPFSFAGSAFSVSTSSALARTGIGHDRFYDLAFSPISFHLAIPKEFDHPTAFTGTFSGRT